MRKLLKRGQIFGIIVAVLMLNFAGIVPTKVVNAAIRTFYVDSVSGNDANAGTSQSAPWRSIAKVNATTFQPGDQILFKAGSTWVLDATNNALNPKGSGTSANPIVIGMYGTGTKPLIQGTGANGSCVVYLANQQYWQITNLQITNPGSTANGERRRGIYVATWASNFPGSTQASPAVLNSIYIKNCEIRNVDSKVAGMGNYEKYWGGIVFNVISSASDTQWVRFNDIRIENNYIHDVSRGGIFVYTDFCQDRPYTSGEGTRARLPLTGVVVRNNYVADIGGDGIVIVGANSPLMEYNVVARPQRILGGDLYAVGMWPFGSYDAVMQYNESFGNQSTNDGQGYDIDYGNKRAVVQYNYSHDNQGGFILVCSGPGSNEDSVVRYNISQNDGGLAGSRIFQVTGARTTNAKIYNNTIYTATNTPKIVASSAIEWEGAPASAVYSNNIFYSRNSGAIYETTNSTSFVNNNFYGAGVPANSTGHITSNPMLVNPGTGTTGGRIDIGGTRGNVDGYKLQASSPCINKGVTIANNGGKDYWGNTLYNGAADIGAFESTGTTTPPPTTSAYAVPGQIEAEGYNSMSGIQTETCKEGGLNVGWIEAGDWMDYNVNVATAGTYTLEYRIAALNPSGTIQLRKGTTVLADTTIPNTGDWQNWTTVSATVTLSAGTQTLRIHSNGINYNLNWFKLSAASAPVTKLSVGKAVTTSSVAAAGYEGSKAVDGNTTTRWASQYTNNQWIYMDLGKSYNVTRVVLNWEGGACGKQYKLQTSNDGVNWTDIYTKTNGAGGVEDIAVNGNGRYVRMYGIEQFSSWGYSLFEFEVYGR